jgi:hypothetical protein
VPTESRTTKFVKKWRITRSVCDKKKLCMRKSLRYSVEDIKQLLIANDALPLWVKSTQNIRIWNNKILMMFNVPLHGV